jgi:hypothetical protein
MMANEKAIDLGKLQEAMRNAEAKVKSTNSLKLRSHSAVEHARNRLAKDHENWMKAREELDKARTAVLEAARAVAQS